MFDQFFKLPIEEQAKIIQKLKQWKKNRDTFLMEQGGKIYKEHTKNIKKEDGWSEGKTMKKKFSIPMEVYMADSQYWDRIIKEKQFKKHPEWMVGK
jgi:predicted nucleotidyltransferase